MSESDSTSSGGSASPRTPPNCARCRNHSLKIASKGHKRYCKYRYCDCEQCRLTADRQKIMALQTAMRRAQQQDETMSLRDGEELHHQPNDETSFSRPRPMSLYSPITSHDHTYLNPSTSNTDFLERSRSSKSSSPIFKDDIASSVGTRGYGKDNKGYAMVIQTESLEKCYKLMGQFRYPVIYMPLIYVILELVKDESEAIRLISRGLFAVNEYSRQHNLNIFDVGLVSSADSSQVLEDNSSVRSEIPGTLVSSKTSESEGNVSDTNVRLFLKSCDTLLEQYPFAREPLFMILFECIEDKKLMSDLTNEQFSVEETKSLSISKSEFLVKIGNTTMKVSGSQLKIKRKNDPNVKLHTDDS